jgi:hypothetical protein
MLAQAVRNTQPDETEAAQQPPKAKINSRRVRASVD